MVEVKEQSPKVETWEKEFENSYLITPRADIFETENNFGIIINLPGVTKENIKIKFEKNVLEIMAKTNFEKFAGKNFVHKESRFGNFYRRFNLSESIAVDSISATLENGQLLLELPKKEWVKPRTININ